jgi:RNA polymerase sigma factor (sigma-70 family)
VSLNKALTCRRECLSVSPSSFRQSRNVQTYLDLQCRMAGDCQLSATLNAIFQSRRRSLMWTVMKIVGDPQTAEDVAQEAYLRTRRAIENGSIEHIEGFLQQTARNLAFDHQRRRKMRLAYEADGISDDLLQNISDDVPSIEAVLLERERFQALQGALSGLPQRAQTVMSLSRIEEWSNRRIAEHLDISERTVFSDLKLALAHCRETLARFDGR